MSTEDTETLSLPSLAIVTILGYLIYRYFFSPSSSTSQTGGGTVTGPQQRYRFTPAQVETVASMFPQLSRRDIMWDLQRNGGSVQATTERVLGGRTLDMAPPSFQPQIPNLNTGETNNTTTNNRTSTVASLLRSAGTSSGKVEPDLITRYNLQDKVRSSDKGKQKEREGNFVAAADVPSLSGSEDTTTKPTGFSTSSTMGWATTKDARQSILQKRRDEMILEARRKMMERDATRGEAS